MPVRRIVSAGLVATAIATFALPFSGSGTCQAKTSAEEDRLDSLQYDQSFKSLWGLYHGAHFWNKSDLEIVKHKGGKKIEYHGSTFLPEFYRGDYPFAYIELAKMDSSMNKTLDYAFDESSNPYSYPLIGFTNLFIYHGFEFEGAVAVDDSLRVVAELRRYNDPTGRFFSQGGTEPNSFGRSSPYEAVLMEEVHYDLNASGPDRVGFYCVSQFKKSNGEKEYEFYMTRDGEKKKEYFFLVPPMR